MTTQTIPKSPGVKAGVLEHIKGLKDLEKIHGFDSVWIHALAEIREYFGSRGHHGLLECLVRQSRTNSD